MRDEPGEASRAQVVWDVRILYMNREKDSTRKGQNPICKEHLASVRKMDDRESRQGVQLAGYLGKK